MQDSLDTDQTVSSFALRAQDFCALVESALQVSPETFLREVHRRLPELYAAAMALPDVTTVADEAVDDDAVEDTENCETLVNPYTRVEPELETTPEHMLRIRALTAHLGTFARYQEVFAPYDRTFDPAVTGNLADDVLDIARDLQRGLLPWKRGEHGVAAWRWQLHFATHWGEHVTGALRALHALAFDHQWRPFSRSEQA